jgi:hypothetical protein
VYRSLSLRVICVLCCATLLQATRKTNREIKRAAYFPKRRYAIKA